MKTDEELAEVGLKARENFLMNTALGGGAQYGPANVVAASAIAITVREEQQQEIERLTKGIERMKVALCRIEGICDEDWDREALIADTARKALEDTI